MKLSGIGRIRVFWHRPIEGKIKTVRIRRSADGWYAAFSCEVEPQPLLETGRAVGVDVGIASLIATSDGQTVENPKWYREQQARLRVSQRRVARRKKGGSNRRKAVVQLRRLHEKSANRRKDYLNKQVHSLIENYDLIALEDLQMKNLVQNHYLAKSILDGGWGYLKQQLTYKAAEAGRELVLVNPTYTSKTCSGCGRVFENLTLSDRRVECVWSVARSGRERRKEYLETSNPKPGRAVPLGANVGGYAVRGPGSPRALARGECHKIINLPKFLKRLIVNFSFLSQ